MANKRVVSFSLSEDLIEFIEKKQKSEKLSNRSVALERILYVYKFMEEKGLFNMNAATVDSVEDNDEVITEKEEVLDEVEKAALEAMNKIFENMPE